MFKLSKKLRQFLIDSDTVDKILQKATVDSSLASLLLEVDKITYREIITPENPEPNPASYNKLKIGVITLAGLVFASIIALAAPVIKPLFFPPVPKLSVLSKSYESSNSLLNSMREFSEKLRESSMIVSGDIIPQEPDVSTNLPQDLLAWYPNQITIETENYHNGSNLLLSDTLFSLDLNFPPSQLSRNADIPQPDSLLSSNSLISLQSEDLPLLSWDFNDIYQSDRTLAKESVIPFFISPSWTPIASSSALGFKSSSSSLDIDVTTSTNETSSTVAILSFAIVGLVACKRHK